MSKNYAAAIIRLFDPNDVIDVDSEKACSHEDVQHVFRSVAIIRRQTANSALHVRTTTRLRRSAFPPLNLALPTFCQHWPHPLSLTTHSTQAVTCNIGPLPGILRYVEDHVVGSIGGTALGQGQAA